MTDLLLNGRIVIITYSTLKSLCLWNCIYRTGRKMNFDDYVQHMTQKYSLAVALAVIKSKPEYLSTQEYIETLRDKITDKQNMEIDHIDICSEDFNINDESFIGNYDAQVENDTNDSVDILRDFEFDVIEGVESNSLNDVFKLLKGVDEETEAAKVKQTKNIDTIPSSINEPTTSKVCNSKNTNSITTDIDNVPENNTTFYASNTEDESMNEQSILIDKKLADIIIKNLNKNNSFNNWNSEIEDNVHSCNSNKLNAIQIENNEQAQEILENSDHTQNDETFTYHERDKMIEAVTKNIKKDSRIGNENTCSVLPYNLHESSENNTHVSQTQTQSIHEIGKELIYGNKMQKKNTKPAEAANINHNVITANEAISSQVIDITNVAKLVENNGRKYIILNRNNTHNECAIVDNMNSEETTIELNNCSDGDQDVNDLDEVNTQMELVPFKIIEELNKIKTILTKAVERRAADGSSSDSGYRSDSQGRSSFKSAADLDKMAVASQGDLLEQLFNLQALHSAGNWLNQSAYSLFNYMTQCPLVATTRDIINEIAKVLGTLIDRLHEEEKYPLFLQDILEHIDVSLRDIFEGDSSDDNALLKKDEMIQRICHLNKSVHILKYTIEKITQQLEKLHSNLTKGADLYELINIEETENSSYLFHLLEILLKKYIIMKANASQSSTQMSQEEDKLLKKSSITDMWRKKWNPNYKEIGTLECAEKKCVLVKCSEVLNKIVVECMGGYSLVAFAALQCFNLLQT